MTKGRMLLAGGGTLGGLVLFGALFAWIATGEEYGPDQQLDAAMGLLDEGRWDLADRIARDIETAGQLTEAREPVWNYVRGVSGVLSTEDKLDSPSYRKRLWDSAEFLEKSQEATFPLGYRGQGAYYLGFCYFNTYDWDKAIETLAEVVDTWPERRSDALDMMVEASLRSQPPKREEAEEYLKQWSDIPGLSASERNRITLARAHLAFLDGDWPLVEETLATISPESVEYYSARLGSGRWKLEAARRAKQSDAQRQERLEQALAEFREVLVAPGTPGPVRRQAAFLTGETFRYLDRMKEAISTLSGVRQRNPHSAEAIAAGMSEAEIQLTDQSLGDALETARHVVNDIGDIRLYNEYWLPLADLRKRLLQLGRDMRDQGEFEASNRLASYLPPVFPFADTVRLEAENFETWGKKLEGEPIPPTPKERDKQRGQVEAKFLLAGDKFRELAGLELRSTEYPDILWHAIECYQKASRLDQANELLKKYLEYEDRAKRPRGLLALGQNYLNAGRWDDVIPPLQRCLLEYPDHPNTYNVRLVMARALTEKQKLEEATEMLLKNLYDGNLRPDSQLWRDSLFELGNVVYRRGDLLFLEGELASTDDWNARLAKLESSHKELIAATDRLSEAVARFDRDRRALEARYAIGRAYRSAAKFPKQMLDSGQVTIDSVRRKLLVERRQLLEQSLAGYRDLREALGEAQDWMNMPESGQALLRNCFFGEADVLFELGQYEEAISAYRNVGNRFMNEPEALEALVQIAECFKQLGQDDQAKRTLTQAEQLLSRIPPEADARFKVVTRADRAKWQQLLAWLKQ
ncbi:MAG: tetratricopeptide repeat protein [Pirellulaceae bacterium]|nr:tetratricopeptide repeat protein [Pirellulaceae bacterium]